MYNLCSRVRWPIRSLCSAAKPSCFLGQLSAWLHFLFKMQSQDTKEPVYKSKYINKSYAKYQLFELCHFGLYSSLCFSIHVNLSFKFIFIFIYFWLHWVFVAACGLSLVVASGGYSLLRCAGFSLRWLLLLWGTGSRCMGFSSCGTRAQ